MAPPRVLRSSDMSGRTQGEKIGRTGIERPEEPIGVILFFSPVHKPFNDLPVSQFGLDPEAQIHIRFEVLIKIEYARIFGDIIN